MFELSDRFVDNYTQKIPPFGFNGLGEFVFYRTYSRIKEDGTNESWTDVVRRVVEGTYTFQKKHALQNNISWNEEKALRSAEEMFDRMWNMKFLPPGRGLWMMGSPVMKERKLSMGLQNCAFVSTENIDKEPTKPFEFLMDVSMLGVGCGFDTLGAGKVTINNISTREVNLYEIPDTREGWVESVRLLLNFYLGNSKSFPTFDYSKIRAAGEPIKGFGGTASGPKPLEDLHNNIRQMFDGREGHYITSRDIVDLMNMIGVMVVAGNVRRTAELALGSYDDEEYLDLKNYEKNPERMEYGWTSNNSINVKIGMDYSEAAHRTSINGEPGYVFLENAKAYGRMSLPPDNSDSRVKGFNPCFVKGTRILTSEGYFEIDKLVGQEVSVWNGREFSKVTPKITGENQPVVKVILSNGVELIATPYHKFILKGGEKIELQDMKPGDKLEKFSMPDISLPNNHLKDAYTQGFFSGDGSENGNKKSAFLYGEKKTLFKYLQTNSNGHVIKGDRIFANFPTLEHGKDFVPINYNYDSKIKWLAGLIDADGCALYDENSTSIQITSNNKKFLLDVRLMLTTMGVDTKVVDLYPEGIRMLPNGKGSYEEYMCKATYRLIISGYSVSKLPELEYLLKRVKIKENSPNRDASRFVEVLSIKDVGIADKVYCFNEPLLHQGTFEGVVTGQCVEQPLESFEVCTLVETFPARHDSLEDYLRTLKFAYLYGKSVTLGDIHWPETDEVVKRNRRIGTSMTGIVQAMEKFGIDEFKMFCTEGYETIRHWDRVYSRWLGVPQSIRVTTVKPSGTVSLLGGATPGVHYPESKYYTRRVRLSRRSNLIEPLLNAGYHIEDSVDDPENTLVVEFPVKVENIKRVSTEISIWEQMEMAAFMQAYWSDNGVSVTVNFDPEKESDQIIHCLNLYQYRLKAVSFLPRFEGGAFPQMPYEEISREDYEKVLAKVKPLDMSSVTGVEAKGEKFCTTDTCEIDFSKVSNNGM